MKNRFIEVTDIVHHKKMYLNSDHIRYFLETPSGGTNISLVDGTKDIGVLETPTEIFDLLKTYG